MSGGADGLRGYIYQQQYVAFRVLSSLAAQILEGYTPTHRVERFSIEGRISPTGTAWDVCICIANNEVQLSECKDTAITKEDRKTFYRRVRKQIQSGTSVEQLTVGWVTDPDKQGQILCHLRGMSALCLAQLPSVPTEPPDSVTCAQSALAEALYYLCSPSDSVAVRPCSIDDAGTLLRQLNIVECRLAELDESVQQLASSTFTAGTGATISRYIVGELCQRVVTTGEASYSLEEFLQAVGVADVVLSASAELRDLLRFNSAAGYASEIPSICWARLEGRPEREWTLDERFAEAIEGSCLIVASIGHGKTVTSQQAFREQSSRRNPYHVLRIEAATLPRESMAALLPLICILTGLGNTWLAIDGLDEVKTSLREEWAQMLQRLVRVPSLTLLVTARKEVVAAHSWLQNVAVSLREREVLPLRDDQISAEFSRVNLPVPTNHSLLNALRNPLLMSLYARAAAPNDMPLATSGEVTGFRVIEEFWRRTVSTTSIGHRSVGDEDLSQHAKRSAIAFIAQRTIAGDLAIRLDQCPTEIASGIEMACRECLLIKQGTHAVRWSHDWIREFGVVDYLIADISTPGAEALVDVISGLQVDHVARTAAVAGLKWALSHVDWGSPEEFLIELWKRLPGHARDVVAVVIEGNADVVELEQLPTDLIAECIRQARLLKAKQWRGQVAALPAKLLVGTQGRDLQLALTEYETEVDTWT